MHPLIANLKGKLIVSVQAYPGEPMRHPETMAQIARAAEIGGAAAIRCQGLSDISAIKGRVHTPEQAAAAIEAGAFAVIVGTAITHPTSITTWFKAAVEG